MTRSAFTRRGLLGGAVAISAGAACSPTSDEPAGGQSGDRDTPTPGEYSQSPMLAERVEAGELPPLADRLPAEPYVVRPDTLVRSEMLQPRIGQYGGRLELAQEGPNGDPVIFLGNIEPLLWAPGGFDYDDGIEGNVVAGYEVNDDDTVFTFHLREGLKWSDGEPVTIEDVRFAFDDVLLNEEITPIFPLYLRPGLQGDAPPAQLEIIDDLTFSLSFAEPYGAFPAQIAIGGWRSYSDIIKPRHYLEQFHKKYADPAEFQDFLEAESIREEEWFNLFNAKQLPAWLWDMTTEQSIGHPTLTAWVLTEAQAAVFRYERNPYYFKIDTEGNQLPYIDQIRSQVVSDQESLTSRALFGEFDYLGERASLRQLPLIAEQEQAGEVKMHVSRMHRLAISFALNQSYADEVWREVVQDIRFRRALSLAINREEVIETFYLGEFASVPTETNPGDFSVDDANQLLDEMGLDQRGDDGFRLGPDGERFQVPLEVRDLSEDHLPVSELVAEYWKDVGIFTSVRTLEDSLYTDREAANDIKATATWTVPEMWVTAGWDDYLPTWWAPGWQTWFTSQGESGVEPTPEAKELFELHARFMAARPGTDEFNDVIAAIFDSHRENIWTINPVEEFYYPTFWSSRIQNVPEGVRDDSFGVIANVGMEQWFIDEDA